MKNLVMKQVFIFTSVVCLLLGSSVLNASNPPQPEPDEIEIIAEVMAGISDVTVIKAGPGITSSGNNNLDYSATVSTAQGFTFYTSPDARANKIVQGTNAGTYITTGYTCTIGYDVTIMIYNCAERPAGLDLTISGTRFTLREGRAHTLVMTFKKR